MMHEQPEDSKPREPDDATIVVPASARAAAEQGQDAGVDDTVVVVGHDAASNVSDHTVVVTQDEALPVGDGTVVVTQNEALPVGDGTVVVTQGEELPVGDGTIVVPDAYARVAAEGTRRRRRELREEQRRQAEQSGHAGEAVPNAAERTRLGRLVPGGDTSALDARRPIAPVPGMLPWDARPVAERGVSQGLPVSYGARTRIETPLETGLDEAQRRVGPAPEATPVIPLEGRSELPSLQRRDKRRTRVTLALYLAGSLACLLGLWGVASIAFGW